MIWGDGFEIETVINCRIAAANLTVVEVPSYEKLRIHGASNLNAVSDGLRVLKTIGTERRRARRIASERRRLELGGREHVATLSGPPEPYISVELTPVAQLGENIA